MLYCFFVGQWLRHFCLQFSCLPLLLYNVYVCWDQTYKLGYEYLVEMGKFCSILIFNQDKNWLNWCEYHRIIFIILLWGRKLSELLCHFCNYKPLRAFLTKIVLFILKTLVQKTGLLLLVSRDQALLCMCLEEVKVSNEHFTGVKASCSPV